MAKKPIEHPGRWIIIFEGPAKDAQGGRAVRTINDDTDESGGAWVYPTLDKARKALVGHPMAPFARWFFNVEDGDAFDV